jgi:kinesin family protein 15
VIHLQEEIKRLKHELILSQARSAVSFSSLDVENGDSEDLAAEDPRVRLRALVLAALRRQIHAEKEKETLSQQIVELQSILDEQRRQAQCDKMIIKFRESMVDMLRKKTGEAGPEAMGNAEVMALREEVSKLKLQIEHHPDVARFAAENLELRGIPGLKTFFFVFAFLLYIRYRLDC